MDVGGGEVLGQHDHPRPWPRGRPRPIWLGWRRSGRTTLPTRWAARAARQALADDGAVLLVEPFANDRLEDNLNPLGRFAYGASTLICVPCSISGDGPGLGAQAETRTRDASNQACFIYEARA